jgi:hypothetical protein
MMLMLGVLCAGLSSPLSNKSQIVLSGIKREPACKSVTVEEAEIFRGPRWFELHFQARINAAGVLGPYFLIIAPCRAIKDLTSR